MADEKIRVRCDAPMRMTINSSLYGVQSDVVEARLLAAHEGVLAIQHGKISGDEGIAAPCKIIGLELVDPAFELKDGQLCDCADCLRGENG